MEEIVSKYITTPFIAVLGIYVVGNTIEVMFKIPSAASYLLSAVGGIWFFAKFYK